MRRVIGAVGCAVVWGTAFGTPAQAGQGQKRTAAEIAAVRREEPRLSRQRLAQAVRRHARRLPTKAPSARPSAPTAAGAVAPVFRTSPSGGFAAHARSLELVARQGSVRLTPRQDGVTRTDLALEYTLESVRANAVRLFERTPADAGTAPILEQPDTVVYRHPGGVEERYRLTGDGVEQTFLLPSDVGLRAGADLVVTGRVASSLLLEASPQSASGRGGLDLRAQGRPVLSCSGAVAIDATGRRAPLVTALRGDRLQITLDGLWLAGAAFPVIIDPLYGASFSVQQPAAPARHADVAHSRTSDRYLVVWDVEAQAGDHDVFGALYSGDGALVAGPFAIDDSADDSLNPSVAWSPNGDRFLVVWQDDVYAMGLNGRFDLLGSFVSAAGSVASSFDVHRGLSTHTEPSVGAEDAPNGAFLIAWTRRHWLTGNRDAMCRLVEGPGRRGPFEDLTGGGVNSEQAVVNKLGRGPEPWLVCWVDDYQVAGDLDVWAMPIERDGTPGIEFSVAYASEDETAPSVAGDGREWVVAYTIDYGQGDLDANLQAVDGAGNLGLLHMVGFGRGTAEHEPAVARYEPAGGAAASAEYLVTYRGPQGLRADRVESGTLVVKEDDIPVSADATDKASRVAARRSHGVPEYLVAWERGGAAPGIHAQIVSEAVAQAPTAAFGATPIAGPSPLVVSFQDRSTGAITGWSWSFGDGVTDSVQNPTHTFTGAGEYTVFVTVTGPGGTDTEIKTRFVTVTGGTAGGGSTGPGSTTSGSSRGGRSGGGGCAYGPVDGAPGGAHLALLALLLGALGAAARRRSAGGVTRQKR